MSSVDDAIRFVLEIERLKSVTRKVRPLGPAGSERYENSAEHSWQLALFAQALAPHCGFPVDLDRVIRMLLVHDLGEIDAGDTLVFVEGGWEQRKADERAGVQRVAALLPAEQSGPIVALWEEFEAGATPEARFATAVDRAMPSILNLNNGGQSWRENGISHERVVKRLRGQIEDGCPALWAWLEPQLDAARAKGFYGA